MTCASTVATDQHERKIRIMSGSHPFALSLNSRQVNGELFSSLSVFLDDLLCQIVQRSALGPTGDDRHAGAAVNFSYGDNDSGTVLYVS
jgi:hypothetical protein